MTAKRPEFRDRRSPTSPKPLPPDLLALADRALRPSSPARDVVQTYLTANTLALGRAEDRARHNEPDSVHKMRVSLRRLRSALRTFAPLLDPDWSDPLRDELSWLGGELGPYRESEVLAGRFAAHAGPGISTGLEVLDAALTTRHGEARTAMLRALGSARFLALRDSLDDACRHPRTTAYAAGAARDVLPDCVAHEWAVLNRRAAHALAAEQSTPAPDADWHSTRIAAKRARYAIDAVAPALAGIAEPLAGRMSDVTDVLGEHQDAAQAAELAAALAGELALDSGTNQAEAIYSLGVLHDIERDRVSMARQAFADLWPDINTSDLTGWFRR